MATNDRKDTERRYPIWRPDYLCKWCLSYVGQRRQFCSADCAAQFKLCQRRREQRQDLNISVDYYGNVKLSIQGLPLVSADGVPRSKRRRKRCKNCARLLPDDAEEFCDEQCQDMEKDRNKNKREDFLNIFQQKEAAERRRIRKWLQDAQDDYTKSVGDGLPYISLDDHRLDNRLDKTDLSAQLKSGPAFPFRRSRFIPQNYRMQRDEVIRGGPMTLNPIPLRRRTLQPDKHRPMDHGKVLLYRE